MGKNTKDAIVTETGIVETTFFVRYAETDQMGVVHHSAYVIWFEEGRSSWTTFGSSGSIQRCEENRSMRSAVRLFFSASSSFRARSDQYCL